MPGKLSFRIAATAAAVSLFLFFTSAYISLRLGALPWPIIFSIVVSAGLLRLTGRDVNRHEVNVAQAGGSIGGLVAAAVAFVLPGLYLGTAFPDTPSPWLWAALAAVAGWLGVLLADRVRPLYIDDPALPYPAGRAGGELIRAGFSHGKLFAVVVAAGAATGLFALVRDALDIFIIPVTIAGTVLPFLIAPMGVGAGYLLGLKTGLNWFAGSVIGIFILAPLAETFPALLADPSSVPVELWVQNIGMGLVLGSGLAHLFSFGRLKGLLRLFDNNLSLRWPLLLSLAGAILLTLTGLNFLASAMVMAIAWLLVPVAAQLTGSTNLDPLEQFGLLAAFTIAAVYGLAQLPLPVPQRYAIAFFVAVATAVAGDIGHDFKSAQIVGTPMADIVRIDLLAVAVLIPAIPVMINLLQVTFAQDLFTATLPAPQAKMVYNTFAGLFDYRAFFGSMALALVLDRGQHRWAASRKSGPKILLIPLGIGLFLGWALSFTIFLGGLIYAWVKRGRPDWLQPGIVIAAGVMGGESLIGFGTALLVSMGVESLSPFRITAAGLLIIVLLVTLIRQMAARRLSDR
ncbi:MAG: OPT/YSL family transporter [Candidatus Marinimicrobia bacterium]|nr:OPT/YSL family transporter [Candidatus Neomarinimicrobiota bacterium]